MRLSRPIVFTLLVLMAQFAWKETGVYETHTPEGIDL
jgi:hypothetical protein